LFRAVPAGKVRVSERWDGALRSVRYLFLLGLPAVAILAADPGVARTEPLSSLFHPRTLTIASGVLLAWAALGSVLVQRFYCKYLCPIGAVSDFLAENRLFGRAPGVPCGGCVRGEKDCRFLRENPQFSGRAGRTRGDCVC
jgi:NosR/NirI family nitrous oxide reductase transcriptional regulator